MKITLNMLLHKLSESYPEISLKPDDQIASMPLKGIRILPDSQHTLPHFLYLSEHASCLSYSDPEEQTAVIYVADMECNDTSLQTTYNSVFILNSRHSMADIFNSMLEIFRMYQDWDRKMHDALIQNKSISELLHLSQHLLNNPIMLYDLSLKLLAFNEHQAISGDPVASVVTKQGYLPGDVVQIFSAGQVFDVKDTNVIFTIPSPKGAPHETIYLPFVSKGVVIGYCVMLMIEHEDELYEKTMFRNFYEYADIAMKQPTEDTRPNTFVYEYFLLDLINNPDIDTTVVKEHCSYAELPYQSQFYLLEFQSDNYSRSLFSFVINQIRTIYPESSVFEMNETIILLIYNDPRIRALAYKEYLEKYYKDLYALTHQYELIGAMASSFREILDIRMAHRQASDVLSLKRSQKVQPGIFYFDREYLSIMLAAYGSNRYGSNMLPPSLKEMLQEDRERGSQNIHLLQAYFNENCNITQTANRLSMHRNNVVYHLRRLETHYNIHPDNPEERLLLQIFLKTLI